MLGIAEKAESMPSTRSACALAKTGTQAKKTGYPVLMPHKPKNARELLYDDVEDQIVCIFQPSYLP